MESERLLLRPWNEDDAEALYQYASDHRVSELALWPQHTSVDMSREVIRNIFMPNQHLYAIVLKDTSEPIGSIGLVPEGFEHYATDCLEREAGYWIGHPYWNKGLTTEALGLLINYCRESLHLDSLLITTDTRNTASMRVAEKCGFKYIGEYVYEGISGKAFRLRLNDRQTPYQ